jgi:hypothetical protein
MQTAVRQTGGYYEVQEVDFGRVYRWCPEHIDTESGERLNETAGWSEDQALHPWRYDARNLDDAGLPC